MYLKRQSGASLFVALMMLIALSIIGLSAAQPITGKNGN